jgi:hypothetical protein
MAHDDDAKKVSDLPYALTQNPAPNPPTTGQDFLDEKQQLVNDIMAAFRKVLPSNYVAATNGPWYSLQFQAMAEQLADIQINSTEILKDSSWDFTRTDFLWQMLGTYVFPGATDKSGIPQIDGDLDYRKFLHRMVQLLLLGATTAAMEGGLEALDPDIIATVVERYLETPPRNPDGEYTIDDQFIVDIFVEGPDGESFPADPFITQDNAALVLAALKPAHVLYTYGYLFRDAFEKIADDADGLGDPAFVFDLDSYHYDDLRKYCLGAKSIVGTGETLAGRVLFSDPTLSFESVSEGATLKITSGVNVGQYRVVSTQALVAGADATGRAYTTSSGGSGTLSALSSDVVEDLAQDWGTMPLDTTLAITAGPNAGTYRLETVLGPTGGPIGQAGISGTQVRLAPTILKVERRMVDVATGQAYEVGVDRLGVRVPQVVTDEDASIQFWL